MVNGLKSSPQGSPAVNSDITNATTGASGGLLQTNKDSKTSAQEAQFGEVWKNIESKYGAKPEKPREIKKTLGKDDFLKIMITQMKHQDPSSPFKAEQFAAQLAQFTSVEQLQNINQGMNKLTEANKPLERLAMANMIGKTVTVDRERFPHLEGTQDTLTFTLPNDAANARVEIYNLDGEKLLEKDLGSLKKGENTYGWDGLRDNGIQSKSGTYIYKVEAKDAGGNKMNLDTHTTANVMGVSFEGKDTVLLIGDPRKPTKVSMNNVVRIDSPNGENPQNLIPGAQSLEDAVRSSQSSLGQAGQGAQAGGEGQPQGQIAAAQAGMPSNLGKMISFEKGKGSSNLDPSRLSPEQTEALARYSAQQQTQAAQAATQAQAQARAQQTIPAPSQQASAQKTAANSAGAGWANGLSGGEENLNNNGVKNNSKNNAPGALNFNKLSR